MTINEDSSINITLKVETLELKEAELLIFRLPKEIDVIRTYDIFYEIRLILRKQGVNIPLLFYHGDIEIIAIKKQEDEK